MKKLLLLPFIIFGIIGICCFSNSASAVTYQTNVPVQFTINPVLSINLSSSDLVISDLAPGSSGDSNIITVGVSTNNLYGFTLSATVGTKTGASTALTNISNSTYKFNNLSSSVGSLANIPDNNWGYSYSSDNGTTWVSGDTGSTTTGYAGLPLDNNDNADERGKGGVLLIDNDGTSNINSVKFKIGAKASSAQPSGEYTNVINFYAVASPKPTYTIATATTLQDVDSKTNGGCPNTLTTGQAYTLTDSRDSTSYRVAKLADGNCWMLDNLALDITDSTIQANLTSFNTNASDIFLNYLKNGGGSVNNQYPVSAASKNWTDQVSDADVCSSPMIAVDSTTSGTCWNDFCVNDPTNGEWASTSVTQSTINGYTSLVQGRIGVYYNYCAASAGSYCWGDRTACVGSPESDPNTSSLYDIDADICPSGWHLPTTSSSSGEYEVLYETYNSDGPSFQVALSTPLSGMFSYGKASNQGSNGLLWSSTWRIGAMNSVVVFTSSVAISNNGNTNSGYSIRCILDS